MIDPRCSAGQFADMTAFPENTEDQTLLHLRGEQLTPLPQGGLWWAARRVLVVSDLHLEKGSSYAARGQMLPPYDTSATLSLVEGMVRDLAPEIVISLGDSFHDRKAEARMDDVCVERVRALTRAVDWVWVEGNHDPVPPAHLGGRAATALRIGALVFRHEPTAELGEIAGHLHPVARIASRQRTLRRKCFVSDGQRLIMPAMGAFTGGLNILHEAFDEAFPDSERQAFVIGSARIYSVSHEHLVDDGPRKIGGQWRMNRSRRNG